MVQGELFREDSLSPSASVKAPSFLAQYRLTFSLDKLLLISIGFVIVFILIYSFGVEQGKRQAEKRFEALIPTHDEVLGLSEKTRFKTDPQEEVVLEVSQKPTPLPSGASISLQASAASSASSSPVETVPLVSPDRGKYTIQLVTYLNEQQAAREIDRLKSKGHVGFVIPSGRHYQVCVNYFQSKTEAQRHLTAVKATGRYTDAFVRPVVR